MRVRAFVPFVVTALLLAFAAPVPAADADLILRRLAGDGAPPAAMAAPSFGGGGEGPKAGLGPLLYRLVTTEPLFARSYPAFLTWLDGVNDEVAAQGGGPFRMQANMRGTESFAAAIQALGGRSDVNVNANGLGITWTALMDRARATADEALRDEGLDLTGDEHVRLCNLLALGQIAALVNRVLPADYLTAWEGRHPDRPQPSAEPPAGVSKMVWKGVCAQIPWMYHAGALPWRDAESGDEHDFYDTFHFFSHGWLVAWGLHRVRYWNGGLFRRGFQERPLTRGRIRRQLATSDFVGFGYEVMTVVEKSGFIDVTAVDDLPPALGKVARFLHLSGLPVVEAVRDQQINHCGARYGAASQATGLALDPLDMASHKLALDEARLGE